jgi:hypothetical protein
MILISKGPPPWPLREERRMSDTIDIRNLSIKCGHCNTYQTLSAYSRRDEWNVYTYECENEICDPNLTRTYLEVPRDLDVFARRDKNWRGGGKHGEVGDGTVEE